MCSCVYFILGSVFFTVATSTTAGRDLSVDSGIGQCDVKYDLKRVTVKCSGPDIGAIPSGIPRNVTALTFDGTNITNVSRGELSSFENLIQLTFRNNALLEHLEPGSFDGLTRLHFLDFYDCAKLKKIPRGVLGEFNNLGSIKMSRCGLQSIPDFFLFHTATSALTNLDLSDNHFKVIHNGSFTHVTVSDLLLENCGIRRIESGAFAKSNIKKLKLKGNPDLTSLHSDAFADMSGLGLKILDLTHTSIETLPTNGLENLEEIYLKRVPSLKKLPATVKFRRLKKAVLTYKHHCCAFKSPQTQNPEEYRKFEETQKDILKECLSTPVTNKLTTPTIIGEIYVRRRKRAFGKFGKISNKTSVLLPKKPKKPGFGGFGGFGTIEKVIPTMPSVIDATDGRIIHTGAITVQTFIKVGCGNMALTQRDYSEIVCTPEPDAFNPCEDVMGNGTLRVLVWIVITLALIGNLVVLLVLLFNYNKMTVSKFLMCNLALADFLIGFYLLMIAAFDLHTLGEYFNYAIEWQFEGGCQVAGFVTILASELSIFTLSVITIERWYAISHAIHLTKRMNLRHASGIMVAGWVFSVILAMLPLIGVSSYSKTSICLPFDTTDPEDIGYVMFVLFFNGAAFFVICVCYLSMYCKVAGKNAAPQTSDATIAKRMAILVFTDFACWAPIAFFGLTAMGGDPLIGVSTSKILLVFFYPLNSCANPFLYAIFTKHFRKDFFVMLSRYGVCIARANRYKSTYVSNNISVSQSRSNNNFIHRSSDGSILTSITDVLRLSNVGQGPLNTPKATPSPKTKGGKLSKLTKASNSENSGSNKDRKFIIVREPVKNNRKSLEKSDVSEHEPLTPPQRRVRSASEYADRMPRGPCGGSRKVSRATCLSNQTGTSVVSDGSGAAFHDNLIVVDSSENNYDSDMVSLSESFRRTSRQRSLDKESGFHSGLPTPEPVTSDKLVSKENFYDMLIRHPDFIRDESRV